MARINEKVLRHAQNICQRFPSFRFDVLLSLEQKLPRNGLEGSWVGVDDAYLLTLGANPTPWLFADTFIDTARRHNRKAAKFIRKRIAIPSGGNPAAARITFSE